ncbi:hypothetical protein EK21DRAFT_118256 [Setomelanomma holmii]|uniref:Uncharacterized protein n=1 Tax=Setomelanomma holmii TaxID=210430 RepID=A0A9P4GXU4_9PLEO|nr:hypothetical protein EK21DRAFT_118256 [Setomelanomma holmii]
MAELAASILTIVGAAYASAKGLYDLIDDLKNAPKAIAETKTDIDAKWNQTLRYHL